MFATLVLAATVAPAQPPAPLPERWLLKHAPTGRLQPPAELYVHTWYDGHHTRAIGYGWDRWTQFSPGDPRRPAAVSVTKLSEREFNPREPADPVHRVVPLAVHGPLVEFDRKLYTASVRPIRLGAKGDPKPQLHLGSAVEVAERVWYQAGTHTAHDGKSVIVEEWRLEFKDDPRTAAEGTVTVRGTRRPLTERAGKAFAAELRFTATPADERTRVRVATFHPRNDPSVGGLSYLQFANESGAPDLIWVEGGVSGWDRLSFTPASRPAPVRLEPDAPGLVQPPVK